MNIQFDDIADVYGQKVKMEEVTISRIFFKSDSWASVLAETKDGGFFRAAGAIYNPDNDGSTYTFCGEWYNDPKYGLQFKVDRSEADKLKPTKDGIIAFLSSGFIKGLGTKKAQRIYDHFGDETYNVIENNHNALAEVKGISEDMCDSILAEYTKNFEFRQLREFLPPEITDLKVRHIYERFKGCAVKTLKDDPYVIITDIQGVGFKTADKIAISLGMPKDDIRRIRAAIVHCLRTMAEDGHCFCYANSLHAHVVELLGVNTGLDIIATGIKSLVKSGLVIVDAEDEAIYHKDLYICERQTATIIRKLVDNNRIPSIRQRHIANAIEDMELDTGYSIDPIQNSAVRMVCNSPFSLITGGPGTGKSTIIRLIVESYLRSGGKKEKIALAAPTGKAARRMTEVTGKEALTIHQLIEAKLSGVYIDGKYDEGNPLPYDLIIVDEASMLDIRLAYMLLKGIGDRTRVVLIGDADQLPPIGPGNVFRDLLTCANIPSLRLQISYRQAGCIAANARHVNEGRGVHAFVYDNTFSFINVTKDTMQDHILRNYIEMVKKFGVANCVVLAPMKARSSSATNVLNQLIRDQVNPERIGCYVRLGDMSLRLGDRVMQRENDWDRNIANGDVGYVVAVDADLVTVKFDSDVVAEYKPKEAFSQLSLAYAMTVHKAQGTEYDGCVVACNKEHYYMLQRNLLYTAITRAKKSVVLLGDARAIACAASTVKAISRNTKLRQLVISH